MHPVGAVASVLGPARAVLDVDVVGARPVRAVPLVPAHPRLAQPRARPDVPPVPVHCDKSEFNVLIPKEYIATRKGLA